MGIRKVVLTAVRGGNAGDSIERCYNELSTKIDFCYDVTLQEARDHLVLAFNASQKHVPQLLAIVASHGIGAQPGTRIAIQDLLTTVPQLRGPQSGEKKRRKYATADRMSIEEIFYSVDSGSHLTFDYLAMVVVAGSIAAAGLLSDSSVTVVASMLVSPLMSPILCITYGIAMNHWEMIRRGFRNEAVGVLLCLLVGPCWRCHGSVFGETLISDDRATSKLDSSEINSRGSPWALLTGAVVAIPSGCGVALAITGGGVNALVGVAISAALLPPIVNSGLCFALAL